MPATIVHWALAGLLAAALLGEAYDKPALGVILLVTAIPDLDSFIALVWTAGHRTVLHTFVIPLAAVGLLVYDVRIRDESVIASRWSAWGVRVAWVAILSYAVAGIGLDLVDAGVNAFWPVHDQFYHLDGKLELSDERGIVQTFVDTGEDGESVPTPDNLGSSQEVNMSTGVDPAPDDPDESGERLFPVFRAGWQLLLFLAGTAVTLARFRVSHELED